MVKCKGNCMKNILIDVGNYKGIYKVEYTNRKKENKYLQLTYVLDSP